MEPQALAQEYKFVSLQVCAALNSHNIQNGLWMDVILCNIWQFVELLKALQVVSDHVHHLIENYSLKLPKLTKK